ncbi:uncharacterized protein LOC134183495 [Corticium candelabrum]|uniref:uncharacterized protein LOC134183495 n=1 Tax=Corticium candelabrum TaxID=121492 RepID=UPI002E2736FE|nr:uncharacterized protein LOC134183495 [Corticium candelabrum]
MAVLKRDMKRALIEMTARPSCFQIDNARSTINSYTGLSLSVHVEYRFLEGFRVSEQSMKLLLESLTGISPKSTQQLRAILDCIQNSKKCRDVLESMEDDKEFAFFKWALTSQRDSDGDFNICIAFAVTKFEKSVPWYGKLLSDITGGAALADRKKFQDAIKVVCTAEMVDFLKV